MMIVNSLRPELTAAHLQNKLRIRDEATAQHLVSVATPLIDAKAVYEIAYVDSKDDNGVVIAGQRFDSRVLRKHLEEVGRVFPFVITIGAALEERSQNSSEMLEQYYLDEIGNVALRKARKQFEAHLAERFALEKVSCMAPGSLADWPIEQQRPLFSLIDGSSVGVTLTESLLMLPRKSLSGIYFPSESSFFSCQLCPRERCEGRKAKYSPELAREYGVTNEA